MASLERSNRHESSGLDSCRVYVTKPFLPPLEEFIPYLKNIWDSRVLTNRGNFHSALEEQLSKYLGVKYISLCSSGTIGLLIAFKALGIKGEVITTPYSFIATAHSLLWSNLTPIFVDIDPLTLNIDSNKIEAAITNKTSAILPVHCYGTPCDVDKIQEIADRYGLKVVYDAAHAFGVKCHCGSILNHGDFSVLSFHATKVFNTLEGGAIISGDLETKSMIDQLLNFGFENETSVLSLGLNGKMNEFNAAFGLLQLNSIDDLIKKRASIDKLYRQQIASIEGISCAQFSTALSHNFSYFPVFVEADYPLRRDQLYDILIGHNIFTRKYFFPLITSFPMYKHYSTASAANLPVASDVAHKVLCLPIFPELPISTVVKICKIIAQPLNSNGYLIS